MISWIIRLCALCSMSALMQMMVSTKHMKGALKTICGLMMLHMTCESAQQMMRQITSGEDFIGSLAWLIR